MNINRYTHICNALYKLGRINCISSASYSVKKQGKILSKLLHPQSKRKWVESYNNTLPTVKSLTNTSKEPCKRALKRVAVLNKLFMKNITDLMSTGSVALDILGRGLEISKVSITANFQIVNVYWVCKVTDDDAETEAMLNRVAGALRHELSQLRVMGEVPTIMFVKDKQQAQIVELDRRLSKADFGEDYTPTEIGHLLKSEFTLETKLSPEMKAKIQNIEDAIEDFSEVTVPSMTHNVYGLEHEQIMNRLMAVRKKSQDAWSKADSDEQVISYRPALSGDESTPQNYAEQKLNISEFLQKRQRLQDKLHKQKLSSQLEREVVFDIQQEKNEKEDYAIDEDYEEEELFDYEEPIEKKL